MAYPHFVALSLASFSRTTPMHMCMHISMCVCIHECQSFIVIVIFTVLKHVMRYRCIINYGRQQEHKRMYVYCMNVQCNVYMYYLGRSTHMYARLHVICMDLLCNVYV